MRTEALTDLLTELRVRFAPGADVREVEIYLASCGYDARQIGEILAAFATHLDDPEAESTEGRPAAATAPSPVGPTAAVTAASTGATFRVMGAYERSRFATDAWGHLLALVAAGTLSAMEREHVIERALMQTDGRIGLGELRALLEGAGLDDGGAAGTLTIH